MDWLDDAMNVLHWLLYYVGGFGFIFFYGMYIVRVLSLTMQKTPTVADKLPRKWIILSGLYISAAIWVVSVLFIK